MTPTSSLTQMKSTPPGEHALDAKRFSYIVSAQVETCSKFWVRVLVFEGTELVLTRRIPIGIAGTRQAVTSAMEIAENYYETREPQLIERQQALELAVAS